MTAGTISEPAEPARRASRLTERVLEPAERALEPAGRTLEPSEWALDLAGSPGASSERWSQLVGLLKPAVRPGGGKGGGGMAEKDSVSFCPRRNTFRRGL